MPNAKSVVSIAALFLCACAATGPLAPAHDVAPAEEVAVTDTVLAVRVIDGDRIEVEGGERVRLLCIDTPERGQPGFDESKAFLRELVEGREVRLEADPAHDDRDRFGRLLRYVWLFTGWTVAGFSSGDDVLVNVEMIERGCSKYETKWGASSLYDARFTAAGD
ncbi:MAG: thermonuclease family protein [Planctomycetes bacterium]|nr:thermonuclease family protein [Planctomycetota bacterium]